MLNFWGDTREGDIGPGKFHVFMAFDVNASEEEQFEKSYREQHAERISKCSGYLRTTRYALATQSILSAFRRSFPPAPRTWVVYEFDNAIPWEVLRSDNKKEWDVDIGRFELVKVFGKKLKS